MTLVFSQAGFEEIFAASCQNDRNPPKSDAFVTRWKIPELLGHGIGQYFNLRRGLGLEINDWQLRHDIVITERPEAYSWMQYGFCIGSERFRVDDAPIHSGHYVLWGSGMSEGKVEELPAIQQGIWVSVKINPELLYSFMGNASEELPAAFQHLVKLPEQKRSRHIGTTTAAMQVALQQILQCPYQEMTASMFLEGKSWELTALLLEQIRAQQNLPVEIGQLKPEDVDRIHYAKELLLSRLDNPPLLTELARQVGLNDCTLKRGFREVFGKTAFGYLHDYRLEQARQLLATEDLKIEEVAQQVGFAARSYFAAAFRKKFGCNPGLYRQELKRGRFNKKSSKNSV